MLGKPASAFSGVSFLRRTEYISSDQGRAPFQSTTSQDLVKPRPESKKRKRPDAQQKKDPIYILKQVIKGFNIAYPEDAYTGPDDQDNVAGIEISAEEKSAWADPKHPSRPDVKLLDSYPLIPDLGALTDTGSWFIVKFISNPAMDADKYDDRVELGLFRPTPSQSAAAAQRQNAIAAFEADPTLPNPGPPLHDFDFFLPSHDDVPAIKDGFSVNVDHSGDGPVERDEDGKAKSVIRYNRLRTYETYQQSMHDDMYGDVVAVALHDGEGSEGRPARAPKAAYYYPIAQRTFIRPRRRMADRMGFPGATQEDEGETVDAIDVVVREPDDEETSAREAHRNELLPVSMQPVEVDAQGEPDE